MVKDTSLYDRLGVAPDATQQEIKKAYRTLAKKHHPDRNPDDPSAVQRFQEIEQAFSILENEEQRQIYDRFGMEGLSGDGGFRNPFTRRQRSEPEAVIHNMSVTLEDMYCGKTKHIQISSQVSCAGCKGKGSKVEGKAQTCSACKGHGVRIVLRQMGPFMQQLQINCPDCSGEGTVIADSDKCPDCKGKKTVIQSKVVDVNIEKGMKAGSRVMLRGAGDEQPGKPAGDIMVLLHELPHERFVRKNHDLRMKQTINLVQALGGFELAITHLDGRTIVVRSKPGEVVKQGQELCVLGEGFPVYKQPFDKGRLIITFDVEFPTSLAPEQLEEIQKLFSLPRKRVTVKPQDEVEEYTLEDVDPEELKKEQEKQQRHHDHAMGDDDDEEMQGGAQGCRVG